VTSFCWIDLPVSLYLDLSGPVDSDTFPSIHDSKCFMKDPLFLAATPREDLASAYMQSEK
jgi:hypothetical protein